jgi:hypothetical protein
MAAIELRNVTKKLVAGRPSWAGERLPQEGVRVTTVSALRRIPKKRPGRLAALTHLSGVSRHEWSREPKDREVLADGY